jgi:hypothetical protein
MEGITIAQTMLLWVLMQMVEMHARVTALLSQEWYIDLVILGRNNMLVCKI